MITPVIFDTDAGSDIDDLYALALIINHPNLKLLGVTTVAGDTQARARLVAKLLRLANQKEEPVCAGICVPEALVKKGVDIVGYRQNLTHCDFVNTNDPEYGREFGDAISFILETLSQTEKPIKIIGTGPWTNIAEVLRRADDKQRSMIGSIELMGGEVHIIHSESNVKQDPEAADLILRSRVPIFLGTWSVTRQLTFTMAEVDSLLCKSKSPFLKALHECTNIWWENGVSNKPGPVCYDVIPVFWAAGERKKISCIKLDNISVELKGMHTRGMTVISPWQLMNAEKTDSTSSEYLTITNSLNAKMLKQRYIDLVFK
jgi:purine nucleosidase